MEKIEKTKVMFPIDSDFFEVTLLLNNESEKKDYCSITHFANDKVIYRALVSLDKITQKPTKKKIGSGFVKIQFLDNNGDVYKTISECCVISKLL